MSSFTIILILTGLYFAIILGSVVYARLKETNSIVPGLNEFFLAGKNLHPIILASTFIASLFSTFSVIGLPGLAYADGIGGATLAVLAIFLGLFFTYHIGRKLRKFGSKGRYFSPIEIISNTYKSRALGLYLSLLFLIFLIPYISLQLVGVGAFIDAYTDGKIGYIDGVGSMMFIVLVYLFLGGMRAVAYTDFIQMIAIFLGLFVGLYYFLDSHDLGYIQMLKQGYETHPDLYSLPGPNGTYTWPMYLTSTFVLTGVFLQPHLMTRALMAGQKKDINTIAWYSGVATLVIAILAFSFGVSAHIIIGDGLSANNVMGVIFKEMAGLGLLGVVLSGFMLMGALGAAMSTADSLLIAIGQLGTRDMIRPYFRLTPKKQVLISKVIMLITLLFAFFMGLRPPQFMTDLALSLLPFLGKDDL
jgi:SSS family solute:Na+ symporter